ncbi:unnamed protein product [Acanthosepion pharaonis]|uniref:Uncharacterized protein n=1 Tax=Acanthosepion pharaonis TaxID=158019 RepID=A0A812DQ38_ACAPH|nr:unnamed protein product [Sepia pharaonis]
MFTGQGRAICLRHRGAILIDPEPAADAVSRPGPPTNAEGRTQAKNSRAPLLNRQGSQAGSGFTARWLRDSRRCEPSRDKDVTFAPEKFAAAASPRDCRPAPACRARGHRPCLQRTQKADRARPWHRRHSCRGAHRPAPCAAALPAGRACRCRGYRCHSRSLRPTQRYYRRSTDGIALPPIASRPRPGDITGDAACRRADRVGADQLRVGCPKTPPDPRVSAPPPPIGERQHQRATLTEALPRRERDRCSVDLTFRCAVRWHLSG